MPLPPLSEVGLVAIPVSLSVAPTLRGVLLRMALLPSCVCGSALLPIRSTPPSRIIPLIRGMLRQPASLAGSRTRPFRENDSPDLIDDPPRLFTAYRDCSLHRLVTRYTPNSTPHAGTVRFGVRPMACGAGMLFMGMLTGPLYDPLTTGVPNTSQTFRTA